MIISLEGPIAQILMADDGQPIVRIFAPAADGLPPQQIDFSGRSAMEEMTEMLEFGLQLQTTWENGQTDESPAAPSEEAPEPVGTPPSGMTKL